MTRLMLFFNSVILLCIAWGANADGPLTDVKLQELLKKRNFPFNEALVDDNGMVYINASGKKVKDLQALEDISVQFLVLSHTEVESLDSLSSVRSLTQVDLSSTKVIDIEGLKNTQLEKLTLANTRVYNLSALTNCPLQYLNISGTKVSDLEPLRKLPLYSLNICNCTAITNLSPLLSINLKEIVFSLEFVPNSPTGVGVIRRMKSLERINFFSRVEDFWTSIQVTEEGAGP